MKKYLAIASVFIISSLVLLGPVWAEYDQPSFNPQGNPGPAGDLGQGAMGPRSFQGNCGPGGCGQQPTGSGLNPASGSITSANPGHGAIGGGATPGSSPSGTWQGTTYQQVIQPGINYAQRGYIESQRAGYLGQQVAAHQDRYGTTGGLQRAQTDGGGRITVGGFNFHNGQSFSNALAQGQGRGGVTSFTVNADGANFTIQNSRVMQNGQDVTSEFMAWMVNNPNQHILVTSLTYADGHTNNLGDNPYSSDHGSIALRIQGNPAQAVQTVTPPVQGPTGQGPAPTTPSEPGRSRTDPTRPINPTQSTGPSPITSNQLGILYVNDQPVATVFPRQGGGHGLYASSDTIGTWRGNQLNGLAFRQLLENQGISDPWGATIELRVRDYGHRTNPQTSLGFHNYEGIRAWIRGHQGLNNWDDF